MIEDLILFYSPNGCSMGSIVVSEWLGVPYRLCRIEKAAHASSTYRALNPLGQTPMLAIGRRRLTENIAVLHHLNGLAVANGSGFVQGTMDFDRMNQLLAFLATSLHPAFTPFFHVDRFADDPAAQATVRRVALGGLRAKLAYVDAQLTPEGLFFPSPTLVEAFLVGIVRWTDDLFDWRRELPRIARCQARLLEDPAVQFALGREAGRDVATTSGFRGEISPERAAALLVGS